MGSGLSPDKMRIFRSQYIKKIDELVPASRFKMDTKSVEDWKFILRSDLFRPNCFITHNINMCTVDLTLQGDCYGITNSSAPPDSVHKDTGKSDLFVMRVSHLNWETSPLEQTEAMTAVGKAAEDLFNWARPLIPTRSRGR